MVLISLRRSRQDWVRLLMPELVDLIAAYQCVGQRDGSMSVTSAVDAVHGLYQWMCTHLGPEGRTIEYPRCQRYS
ncbi:hypothetical protein KIPB_005970 [Kipferlia bialata]|uniref:Uncharacterized protein n=1 Tax=Kipferlia bialata TaxID=797122 RepID=A0A391NPF2_9EUKA|nr:hypothetical protein KIPB_005970 [Kipferlia bialata]|eukprot:g5970.t1